jgi:hypothetical protein
MKLHLQEKHCYEDRYDRLTVEDCLRSERFFLEPHVKCETEAEARAVVGVNQCAWEIKKIFLTLDWYKKKEETINEWMQADKERDDMLETANAPRNITCSKCHERTSEESRTTWERGDKEEVLFFMKCSEGHLPMKGVFADGVELKIKDRSCPECSGVIEAERLPSMENVIKTKYSCSNCNYADIDSFSLSTKKKEDDTEYNKNRARFCLAGQELKDAQEAVMRMENMKRLVDSWKHREEHKEQYDAADKLQKLTIPQVKELMLKAIESAQYQNPSFEKPKIERFVSMEFSLEELKTDNPLASTSNLQKLIKQTLKGTNWRLMSDGVSYRLGLMSGRLRAYESKEDLLKLVE